MNARRLLLPLVASAVLAAGCGYIVTPAEESTPTPAVASGGGWSAVATKVDGAGGALHVDLTIVNGTGAWSAMQATPSQPAVLTTGDGKTAQCAGVVVGTGGTPLAPGFQIRGYTGGPKSKPAVQLLSVDCAGAAPAAGSKLTIPYSFTTGDFNYYSPSRAANGKLEVNLDAVATDLKYPVATPVEGIIEPADTKIDAINHCTLTLASAKRAADSVELAWHTTNPTAYPTYVHIGIPPVLGSDGVIHGFYESPHLAEAPITPAGESADWTTKVTVPADVTGLYVLVMVESKQQKTFVSHAIDITST